MQFLTRFSIPSLNRQLKPVISSIPSSPLTPSNAMQRVLKWNNKSLDGNIKTKTIRKCKNLLRIVQHMLQTEESPLIPSITRQKSYILHNTQTQSYSMTGKHGGSTLDVMQSICLTTGEPAHGSGRTREHNKRKVSSLSSSTISIIKRPKVHAFFSCYKQNMII